MKNLCIGINADASSNYQQNMKTKKLRLQQSTTKSEV